MLNYYEEITTPILRYKKNSDDPLSASQLGLSLLGVDIGGFFDDVSEVIANGFMLSCINSTFTPRETSEVVQNVYDPFFRDQLVLLETAKESNIEERFNNYVRLCSIHIKMHWDLRVNHGWQKCSRLALDVYTSFGYALQDLLDDVIQAYLSYPNYIVSVSKKLKGTLDITYSPYKHPLSKGNEDADYRWHEHSYEDASYNKYSFVYNGNSSGVNTGSNSNLPSNNTGGNASTTEVGAPANPPNINNTSKTNYGKILGFTALTGAVGFGIYKGVKYLIDKK